MRLNEFASMGGTSSGGIATAIAPRKKTEEAEQTRTSWPTTRGKWANSFKGGFDSQSAAEEHYRNQTKRNKETKVHVSQLAPIEDISSTIHRR